MNPMALSTLITETSEDDILDKKGSVCEEDIVEQMVSIVSVDNDQSICKCVCEDYMTEPKTGFKFPSTLVPHEYSKESSCTVNSTQVLGGVGARTVSVLKVPMLKIYAFGFYIKADSLRAELASKYRDVALEELKLMSSFYEDLLRYELDMSVRLIVHHKRVRIGMVKSAFESALKNRLKKIKKTDSDHGVKIFSSYFNEDLQLPAGTVIDFHWQPGGKFHTKVGDRVMGTIHSVDFCRAFFDIYIGEPPVCNRAKQDIGFRLGQLLRSN